VLSSRRLASRKSSRGARRFTCRPRWHRLIASDTGWPYDLTVGGVSVGLLVAGLASPRVGRLIAKRGGRPVLVVAALLLATGLLGIGTVSSPGISSLGW
jgi:hypothetical protein